jgi:hypothetical protein
MALSHIKLAILVLSSLVSLSMGEIIALANGYASGAWSSQIAYFSGWTAGQPDSVAYVDTPTGTTVQWEGRPVSATFGDGNIFTSHIRPGDTAEYAYGGSGKNNAKSFSC